MLRYKEIEIDENKLKEYTDSGATIQDYLFDHSNLYDDKISKVLDSMKLYKINGYNYLLNMPARAQSKSSILASGSIKSRKNEVSEGVSEKT